ncbi:MAG: hypothetical protein GY849_01675 [Deltaproteobacteria bacterium]|nr:hypothetical protein [Deltaproteobacteria bacterium]
MHVSRYFTQQQLVGLQKAGDVILPGTARSPSFSATGCMIHIDRMAAFLSHDDLGALRLLFGFFRWAPLWLIRLLMVVATHNGNFPGPVGAGLRLIEIGLKGAVMSLYYSNLTGSDYRGEKIFDVIGWNPKIVMREGDVPSDPVRPQGRSSYPTR